MKSKLLLVTDEMEVGGTQRQMVNLVRGINRDEFEVEVAYFRVSSFLVDELKAMGVVVHHVPKQGRIDVGFFWALRTLIARGQYDLVHAFSFTSELWTAAALASIRPAQRGVFVSSVRGTYEWYSAIQWRLKRWVTTQSVTVIANSKVAGQYAAEKMNLPASKIQIIYNGLPPAKPATEQTRSRETVRAALGIATDAMLLLFVGRLVSIKNLPTLLEAMSQLPGLADDTARPVMLVLVGDGPDKAALAEQTDRLGLRDSVQWLGERRDVPALMNASDAVVLPSWREGLSNVILEASQAAKPVIASRAGGNVESVFEGETGLLFEPADAQALAVEILRLASDPEFGARLGVAGQVRCEQMFTLAGMAEKTQNQYRQALGLATNQEVLV